MMKATCADGTEVTWPEPMREAPEMGTLYYTPDIQDGEPSVYNWDGKPVDIKWFEAGLVFETAEGATQCTKAMYALSRGSANWEQK